MLFAFYAFTIYTTPRNLFYGEIAFCRKKNKLKALAEAAAAVASNSTSDLENDVSAASPVHHIKVRMFLRPSSYISHFSLFYQINLIQVKPAWNSDQDTFYNGLSRSHNNRSTKSPTALRCSTARIGASERPNSQSVNMEKALALLVCVRLNK